MKWLLLARNKSGAAVTFKADTKKAVLNCFDNVYKRKGFKIYLSNAEVAPFMPVKTTFK